jgi:hypothetical protein
MFLSTIVVLDFGHLMVLCSGPLIIGRLGNPPGSDGRCGESLDDLSVRQESFVCQGKSFKLRDRVGLMSKRKGSLGVRRSGVTHDPQSFESTICRESAFSTSDRSASCLATHSPGKMVNLT